MQIHVLGCYGGEALGVRMTCLLVEGSIALDAGSLAEALPVGDQVAVRSIVLTHSHMDHTAAIPFFVENVYSAQRHEAIEIYASGPTIYALRRHLFNNATWPDFTRIPNHLLPAVRFIELEDEVPVTIDGVTFTPIPVDHLVPTYGYLIEKGGSSVLWSSDTGPTRRLWEIANRTPNLKAVCLETTFDNSLQQVADVSQHLTPQTLAMELTKLEKNVPVYLHHLKPACIDQIQREVKQLRLSNLLFLEQGRRYDL
jgi:ribonuclease BN (tRNA processing enzyme)